MGRVGKYTYPEEPLEDVIEYLYKIKDFFGEKNVTGELPREAIAEAWNLAYRSGTFNTRIASLVHYGFAEKAGSGTVRLTNLAMDVLYPDPMTKSDQEAKREAFFNIQLFKDLFEQFGASPTVEQVKWFLRQKSNAEPPIVEKKSSEIHKVYIESVTEISTDRKGADVGMGPSKSETMFGVAESVVQKPEGIEELKFGDVRIYLPPTHEGVEIAKNLIALFEKTMLKKIQNTKESRELENKNHEE